MSPERGFPPVAGPGARVLVLGSMPGAASLAAGEYYAHPRNAFWWIMGQLHGAGPELPYAERCAVLVRRGVAVWDALHRCVRPGSLDSAIERGSEEVNDFAGLFERCPHIRLVAFNGAKAEEAFRRHASDALATLAHPPRTVRLPSTSPAMAALTREQKLARWREGLLGAEA
jgi:TDG/mug DNA glycosylase family protein